MGRKLARERAKALDDAVTECSKDLGKDRALQRAVHEKINSITTQVAQARSRSLTARAIEVLPPELLEHVNEYLCNTSTMEAFNIPFDFGHRGLLISSKVTNFQGLCTFVDMAFAQQLIEHWYRKTRINFFGRELCTDGPACRDFWGSSIVPHLFIRTLGINLRDDPVSKAFVEPLVLLANLSPGLQRGARITVRILRTPMMPCSKEPNRTHKISILILVDFILAPIAKLVAAGHHVEVQFLGGFRCRGKFMVRATDCTVAALMKDCIALGIDPFEKFGSPAAY
jgi:hypothetical protein